ncbi:DUF2510 domain-containing protein [Cnuibacter sp. UC19_7]|uniref:DUF2510 domain-containing protein n=1 Tax=Cnuibacter sp. UC19_7 TaxID=3350166 RepID=UPI00366C0352
MSDGGYGNAGSGAGGTNGGATPPPGWHPDPAGSGMQRWWDGTQWTGSTQWPSAPAFQGGGSLDPNAKVAPGTPVYTPWIWLIVLLPLVSYALLPWVFGETIAQMKNVMTSTDYGTTSSFSMSMGPANLVTQLIGWVIWGVTVLFAWLDYRTLRMRGFVRPFHWAFAFIPAPVYPIGRSIVARRRSGRGMAPLWVTVGMFALGLIVSIVLTVAMFNSIPWNELSPSTYR